MRFFVIKKLTTTVFGNQHAKAEFVLKYYKYVSNNGNTTWHMMKKTWQYILSLLCTSINFAHALSIEHRFFVDRNNQKARLPAFLYTLQKSYENLQYADSNK